MVQGAETAQIEYWNSGTTDVLLQAPFLQPFARQSLASQELILQNWALSSILKILEVRHTGMLDVLRFCKAYLCSIHQLK